VLRYLTVRIDTGRLSLDPSAADEAAEQGAGGEEG